MCFSGVVCSVRRGVSGVEGPCKCVTVALGGLMVVENRDRELSSRTGVRISDISSLHHRWVPSPDCQGGVPFSDPMERKPLFPGRYVDGTPQSCWGMFQCMTAVWIGALST